MLNWKYNAWDDYKRFLMGEDDQLRKQEFECLAVQESVLKDKDYIERMPKEKIETILLYNEQDVVNLYKIFTTWKEYIIDEKYEIEDVIEEYGKLGD